MIYPIAEKFKAPQGEGVYTGTPMAFIRFVGCSVGKRTCTACDTDFETILPELGGGKFTGAQLLEWAEPFTHICLTGGEPLDRDLSSLLDQCVQRRLIAHIETSGTVFPKSVDLASSTWITVCPKPGYKEEMLSLADEIKVIHGGLGDGVGWPTIEDAVRWHEKYQVPVYIQPRNDKLLIDNGAMRAAIDVVMKHPQLRLSAQLHKYIRTR